MTPPYTRTLSLFYALYFGLLGCIAPYWGLFLQDKEFSAEQIGILMSCFGLMRIIAPNLWAYLRRYFHSPLYMIRVAAIFTLLCFSFVPFASTLLSMAMVMMLYGFFWAAMLPQYELMTMRACAGKVGLYSRIRAWGSIGFVITVLFAGLIFDWISVRWLPLFMFVLMVCITFNSFCINNNAAAEEPLTEKIAFWPHIVSRPVILFLLMVIFLQISHGPYYTFFSIYLEENGYASSVIGVVWTVGVIAEVALFWFFQRFVHWFSWRAWCVLALFITALRWLIVAAFADIGWLLLLSQLGHAFSFAVMHAASMNYVQQLFPQALQARGQALYASVGFGFGGAFGALMSGMLWEPLGGAWVFVLAAVCALVGMSLAWFGLPKAAGSISQTA